MRDPEERLIGELKKGGVDFLGTLPCDRVKSLILLGSRAFRHLPLTREEEGVGISAGVALAGGRPAMIVQSSGAGNMINALMSLTGFYGLPLAMFFSRRGVYKEAIAAQAPVGVALPRLLEASGVAHTDMSRPEEIGGLGERLEEIYGRGLMHAYMMSPALWEGSGLAIGPEARGEVCSASPIERPSVEHRRSLTRRGVIEALAPWLDGKAVICNLGVPSKELHEVLDQPSNFYMLGSMGMATPIGLGVAMFTGRDVVVIDGDGGLMMSPGALASVAMAGASNLTIVCIDNASYGSTGDLPTQTAWCVDLGAVARGFGIADVMRASTAEGLSDAMEAPRMGGPRFIHAIARPGNSGAPNIGLAAHEIRDRFMRAMAS